MCCLVLKNNISYQVDVALEADLELEWKVIVRQINELEAESTVNLVLYIRLTLIEALHRVSRN